MVKVPPCNSWMASFCSRAAFANRSISAPTSRSERFATSLTTKTVRPCSVEKWAKPYYSTATKAPPNSR